MTNRGQQRTNEEKSSEARNFFLQGFEVDTIATVLDVPVEEVSGWVAGFSRKPRKKLGVLRMREIQHMLLDSLLLLKSGKKPAISADQVLKYSQAYEKLFGRKKVVLYMQDSFDTLTTALVEEVERAPTRIQEKKGTFCFEKG